MGKDYSCQSRDAAGSMTFDGSLAHAYDAQNRLVTVSQAYRDPGTGIVSLGSTFAEYQFDPLCRRFLKDAYLRGTLNTPDL